MGIPPGTNYVHKAAPTGSCYIDCDGYYRIGRNPNKEPSRNEFTSIKCTGCGNVIGLGNKSNEQYYCVNKKCCPAGITPVDLDLTLGGKTPSANADDSIETTKHPIYENMDVTPSGKLIPKTEPMDDDVLPEEQRDVLEVSKFWTVSKYPVKGVEDIETVTKLEKIIVTLLRAPGKALSDEKFKKPSALIPAEEKGISGSFSFGGSISFGDTKKTESASTPKGVSSWASRPPSRSSEDQGFNGSSSSNFNSSPYGSNKNSEGGNRWSRGGDSTDNQGTDNNKSSWGGGGGSSSYSSPYDSGSSGGAGRGRGRGRGEKREGDWTCAESSCANSNFGWRKECFRCNAPKPEGVGSTSGGTSDNNSSGGGYGGGYGGGGGGRGRSSFGGGSDFGGGGDRGRGRGRGGYQNNDDSSGGGGWGGNKRENDWSSDQSGGPVKRPRSSYGDNSGSSNWGGGDNRGSSGGQNSYQKPPASVVEDTWE